MLEVIREAWGWVGLDPVRIETTSAFGNIIVEDSKGRFWRICPEELSCKTIAPDHASYQALWTDAEFVRDFDMVHVVEQAARLLGPLTSGRSYCLKIPAVLRGEYDTSNLGTIDHSELIAASGNAARQVKDLPDGTTIMFKVVD